MSSTQSLSGRTGIGHWPVDVSSIDGPDARAVVVLAITVGGWTAVSHKGAPWTLVSEDGTQIQVPTNTGLRASVFRSMVNKVLRHSGPALVGGIMPPIVAIEAMADQLKVPKSTKRTLVTIYTSFVEAFAVALPLPDDETAPAPTPPEPPQAVEEPEPTPTPAPAPPAPKPKRAKAETPTWLMAEPVERKPFLAKVNSAGDLYESATTVELRFADGHVGYECSVCGWRRERQISVARHYANMHAQGRSPQPPPIAHDPTVRPFDLTDGEAAARRQARIDRLAAELFEAKQALGTDEDVTLERLAEAVIDRRIRLKQDDETGPAEPMTDEQIINRIAVLVDRGRTATLLAEVQTLRETLEAERVARAKTLADVSALGDLIAAMRGEDPAVAS